MYVPWREKSSDPNGAEGKITNLPEDRWHCQNLKGCGFFGVIGPVSQEILSLGNCVAATEFTRKLCRPAIEFTRGLCRS